MSENYVKFGEVFEWRGVTRRLCKADGHYDARQPRVVIYDYNDRDPWFADGDVRIKPTDEAEELMRCIRREGEFAPKTHSSRPMPIQSNLPPSHLQQVTDVVFGAAVKKTVADYPNVDPAELETYEEHLLEFLRAYVLPNLCPPGQSMAEFAAAQLALRDREIARLREEREHGPFCKQYFDLDIGDGEAPFCCGCGKSISEPHSYQECNEEVTGQALEQCGLAEIKEQLSAAQARVKELEFANDALLNEHYKDELVARLESELEEARWNWKKSAHDAGALKSERDELTAKLREITEQVDALLDSKRALEHKVALLEPLPSAGGGR